MITVAMIIPMSMAPMALPNFMWRRAATREPVHAPVPGSGMPTKRTRPQNPNFSICPLFLSAFCRIQTANFPSPGMRSMTFRIFSMSSRMNGIGSRLPITQMGMARRIGTFKRAGDAASSPPRSSRIGIMEMIKMITSPDTFPPSREASPCTRVSVITYPHFSV